MASKQFLEKAYLAYFGRPVDPTGLRDFQNSTEAEVEAAFFASPESKALYGNTFGAIQINAIYNVLFGRDAEPAGVAYWVHQVELGLLTPAGAALGIMAGAQNSDVTAVQNKLAASELFTAALDTAIEVASYSGDTAAATARGFLQTIEATPATSTQVNAAVQAMVASGNHAPVAQGVTANGLEDAAVISLMPVSSDVDAGDTAAYSVNTQPAHGTVSFNAVTGKFDYVPAADFNGTDTFTYKVTDGSGATSVATATVTVAAVNDVPVFNVAPNPVGAEDTNITGTVIATDVERDALSYSADTNSNPGHGTVVVNPNGTFIYTPAANYHGTDAFGVLVSDGSGAVSMQSVTVTVNSVNDAPVALAAVGAGLEDAAVISVTPASSDVDTGDTAAYAVNSQPADGTVSFNAVSGNFDYVPAANFNGTDSFSYKVTDGSGATSVATATVIVTAVNDAPVAQAAAASVNEGAAVITGSVTATDIDSAALTYALNAAAPAGLTFNANGTYSFDAGNTAYNVLAAGVTQTLTVGYTVTDGALSDSKNLVITITGTNDAPVALAVQIAVNEDAAVLSGTLKNGVADIDTASTSLAISLVSGAPGFSLANDGSGNWTFNPADAAFQSLAVGQTTNVTAVYQVSDGAQSAFNTVTFTVSGTNDAPVAQALTVGGTEDQVVTGQVSASDVDGDVLSYGITGAVTGGAVSMNATTGAFVFTPAANFNGNASFTYNAIDGKGGTNSAVVTLNIGSVNDAPTAGSAQYATAEDVAIDLTGNLNAPSFTSDVDTARANLVFTQVTGAPGFTLNTDGTWSFDQQNAAFQSLKQGQVANYVATYQVSDGSLSANSSVTFTVTGANDAPVVSAVAVSGFENTVINGQVSGTDVDGDTLTYSASVAVGGSVVMNAASGAYVFTPTANFNGIASFTYTATDGIAPSSNIVTINVADVNNILTAGLDSFNLANGTLAELVLGSNNSLNAGDSITGGAEDTVFLSTDSAQAFDNYASFILNGVGTFKVSNDSGDIDNFDLSSSSDVRTLTSINSTSDVRFNFANMNDTGIVGLQEVNLNILNLTNGVSVTLDIRNDDAAGNDQVNILVTDSDDDGIDASSINLVAQGTTSTAPVDQNTASGIETVNLSTVGSTGGVRIDDFNTPGSTVLNIVTALNQSLTIGDTNGNLNDGFANALSSTIATINAGTATGDLNFSTEDRDTGATTITLGSGNDSVITGDANDNVTAGAGNDTIRTGAGADSVQGNEGNDIIDAGTGQNTVRGGDGNDTITASGLDSNQIYGDAGNDTITVASTGAATIEGGDGNDTIVDITGSSVVIDGNAGNDTITAGNATGSYDIDAGADNDTVNIGANLHSDSDGQELGMRATTSYLDGGAGTDTLNATTDSGDSNDLDDVTGFETIKLGAGAWSIAVTDESAFDKDTGTSTVIDATTAAVLNFQGNDLTPWTGVLGSDVAFVNSQRGDDVLSRDITVLGSAGNDTIVTGLGNDSVAGNAGNDSISTGAGNDTVTSGIGNDNVDLGAGNDRLIVNSGELNAEVGNDTVAGGQGNDTIELIHDGDDSSAGTMATTTATLGGAVSGIETVLVTDNATDENGQVNIDFTAAYRQTAITVDGSALTAGDKLIVDTRAQDGDTAADGGVNVNEQFTLIGGAGNDTFLMGNHLDSGDSITGNGGTDTLVTDGAVVDAAFTNVQSVEVLTLTTGAAVASASVDDSVTLGAEAQEAGISTVNGGDNNDVINAAAYTAALTVNANSGDDTVITGSGADTIHGNDGNDNISSNGGDDVVFGDAGNDIINAGEGNNSVDGGTGNDNIVTGSGMDTVIGGDGNDVIDTGAGDDLVFQGIGADNVTLGAGTNTVYVTGTNQLEASDTINGTLGIDTVNLRDSDGTDVTVTVNLDNVTGVENYLATDTDSISLSNNKANVFILNFQGGNVTTLNTITVSAAGLVDGDGDALNVNLSGLLDKDFAFNITGAGGNDTVTGSILPENLNFSGGAGNDVLNTDGTDMGSTTTYDGGTDIDTVNMISGALSDDSFDKVSNVEIITATGIALDAQLGSVADRALTETAWSVKRADGPIVDTITNAVSIGGTAFNDRVIVDAAFNDGLIIDLSDGGDDRINVAASSSTVTYLADASDITAGDTLSGGTGTGDSLRLAADNGVATLTNVTGVETFIVTEDADFNATLNFVNGNFTNVASGILTVDATALNDDGYLGDTEGSFIMNAGSISAGKFVVTGGTGADTIVTGSGNDIIDGGADYSYGAAASDNINAGEGANTVTTRGGNDTIVTGAGNDTIVSGAGNDNVQAGAGNDNVQAGEGNNTVNAGDGMDVVTAGNGNNVIDGGAGVDTITVGNGNNILTGGLGNDTITAGAGNNVIDGGAGNDTITVGGTLLSANTITGGHGADIITAGAGADTFRYVMVSDSDGNAVTPNRDTIIGFDVAQDKVAIETAMLGNNADGVKFAGNAADFSDAQGAVSLTANDGMADYVYQADTGKLWVDVNDDGILNGLDLQVMFRNADGTIPSSLTIRDGSVVLQDTIAPAAPTLVDLTTDSGMTVPLQLDNVTNVDPSTVRVSFATSGEPGRYAEVGDEVQLVNSNGVAVPGSVHALTLGDIASGFYDFAGVDLSEGVQTLTARIIDVPFNDPQSVGNTLVNGPLGETSTLAVTLDSTAPTASLVDDQPGTANDADPVVGYTVTFNEPTYGFTASDLVVGGGTASNFVAVSSTVYTFDITAADNSLVAINVTIPAGAGTDVAANNTPLITATQAVNTVNPTLVITDDEAGTANIAGGTVTYTFQFSEAVTGFIAGDVVVANGTKGALTAVDADTYTMVITPAANFEGTLTVSVAADAAAASDSGNLSLAASSTQLVDTLAPTLAIATPIAGDGRINAAEDNTVVIAGNAVGVAGQTVTVTVNDANGATPAVTGTATVLVDGTWSSSTLDVSGLDNGTLTVTAAVSDVAGNPMTANASVILDNVTPVVTIISDDQPGTVFDGDDTVHYTVTFNEAMVGFTASDLTVSGGTVSNFSGSGASYDFDVTAPQDSVTPINVSVGASVATDLAGNANAASAVATQVVDTRNPTIVSITDDQLATANIADQTVQYTVNFSEAVTGFTAADLTVTGGAVSGFAGSGATYTFDVTAPLGTTTPVEVSIAANTLTDLPGNLLLVGGAAASQSVDTTAPSVSISDDQPGTANDADPVVHYTVTFSEPVLNFVAGDLTVVGGSVSGFSGSGTTYGFDVTATDGSTAPITVSVAAGTANDAALNPNTASAVSSQAVDTENPFVVSSPDDRSGVANGAVTYTITFNEAVTGLSASDFTVANGQVTYLEALSTTTYLMVVAPDANEAGLDLGIALVASAATDGVSNASIAYTFAMQPYDTVAPAVPGAPVLELLSDSGVAGDNLTNDTTPTLRATTDVGSTVTFFEDVDGDGVFDAGELSATSAALTVGQTFVTATMPVLGTGAHSIKTFATDIANNVSNASDATVITIDVTAPTVTSIVIADTQLKAGDTSLVTFNFSEAVMGFDAGDVTVPNGVLSGFAGAGTTYTATLTPNAAVTDLTNLLTVGTGLTDLAGNAPVASTNSGNFTVDTVTPTVLSMVMSDTALKIGDTSTLTVTFSEVVAGVDATDFMIDSGTLGAFASADGITWTSTFTSTASVEDTSNIVTLVAAFSGIADLADATGNSLLAGGSTANYTVDTVRPTLAISDDEAGTANIAGGNVTYTFTFSEAMQVGSFTASDVVVVNGTKGTFTSVDPSTYTLVVTPTANFEGNMTVDVAANAAFDLADATGNGNVAAAQSVQVVDTQVSTISINTLIAGDGFINAAEDNTVNISGFTSSANAGFDAVGQTVTITADDANGLTLAVMGTATVLANGSWTSTTLDVSGLDNGTLTFTAGVSDVNGNPAVAATATAVLDNVLPTVTSIVIADTELKIGDTSLVTFNFSEAVTGFDATDVTVANGSLSNFTAVSATVYTADLTASAGIEDASNVLTVGTGLIDIAGNAPVAATSSVNYTVDTVRPTVTSIVLSDTALSLHDDGNLALVGERDLVAVALTAGVAYNLEMRGLSTSDGTLPDTYIRLYAADGVTLVGENDDSGVGLNSLLNYLPPVTGIYYIEAGAFADIYAGTYNLYLDGVVIERPVTATVTFSEAVTGVDAADFTVQGGSLSGFGTADGGITWTATFKPDVPLEDASNVITLNAAGSGIADLADATGNALVTDASSANYTVDTVTPTVVSITMDDTALNIGDDALVTVVFSEAVLNVNAADFTADNGALGLFSTADGGITWTSTFTPTALIEDASNVVTLVAAGSGIVDLADATGNSLLAGASTANYQVDTLAPVATLTTATYNNVTNTLVVNGTGFVGAVYAAPTADATKLTWDIDASATLDPDYNLSGASLSVAPVITDTTMTFVLTNAAAAALEGSVAFTGSTEDGLDVAAALLTDPAGNMSVVTADNLLIALNLTGNDNPEVLFGGRLNDTIDGGLGNDTITGSTFAGDLVVASADNISGGQGNDVLWGGLGLDTVLGGAGDDTYVIVGTLTAGDAISYNASDALNGVVGYTVPLAARATSDAVAGEIYEGATGTGLNDTLHVYGTVNLATVDITGIENVVMHSTMSLTTAQLLALDTIDLSGDVSHTIVITDGGTPAQQEAVFDTWLNQSGENLSWSTTGPSTSLTVGSLTLTGASAIADYADAFVGELGYVVPVPLTLVGNASANVLTGGGANDTITGGGAADILTGGAGADLFVFNAGDSTDGAMDVITDFVFGVDLIDVSSIEPMHSGHGFSYLSINAGDGFADYAAVRAAAASYISGDNFPVVGSNGVNTWVFFNDGHNGSLGVNDTVIELAGVTTTAGFTMASIVY